MAELVLYIGKPGSGKTTHYNNNFKDTHVHVSQDLQGKQGHREVFEQAIAENKDVVVDRQNHIRIQRKYYIDLAKEANYSIRVIEFKVNRYLAEYRIAHRKDHPSISSSDNVAAILQNYDKAYQSVLKSEVENVETIKLPFYAPIQDLSDFEGTELVIGDPHGCFDEVKAAIDEFKPDRTIIAGDLNDRGPKIRELFDFVRSTPNVYCVMGNHDHKFMRWLRGNKVNTSSGGLNTTIEQFSDYTEQQKAELAQWIGSLPLIIKLAGNRVVVHAGVNPERPLEKQHFETCLYIRHHGGKAMDDESFPRWYEYEPCDELKDYHILFGHAIHDKANVSKWATSLDMGAVYGTGLRVQFYDTRTHRSTIKEYPTQIYYKSQIKDRSPFFKKDELVTKGFLTKSEYKDLVLYNYTDKNVFERNWHKDTLESRGTIYNKDTGKIVAKAFPKFFNINETEDTLLENLPWDKPFQVFDKCDGSLGVLYHHQGEYRVSTRGSFYSDQAKKATEMLNKYDLSYLEQQGNKYTLLFEIIYPENKIIVDYGDREELVVLGAYNLETLEEVEWSQVEKLASKCGFNVPQVFNYTLDQMLDLREKIKWNESEGWIVRFSDGSRVKIKGVKYLEMAKVLSHMSPLAFWEAMIEKRADLYLQEIPEELRDQAEEIYNVLHDQLAFLKNKCELKAVELNLSEVDTSDRDQRKKAAQSIQNVDKWMRGYLYHKLSGKTSDEYLIKLIRPTANEYVELDEITK